MNSGPVWAIVVRPTVTVARTWHEASVKHVAGMPPKPDCDTNADVPAIVNDLDLVTSRCGPEPLVENGTSVNGAETLGPPISWTVAVTFSRRPRACASMRRAAGDSLKYTNPLWPPPMPSLPVLASTVRPDRSVVTNLHG